MNKLVKHKLCMLVSLTVLTSYGCYATTTDYIPLAPETSITDIEIELNRGYCTTYTDPQIRFPMPTVASTPSPIPTASPSPTPVPTPEIKQSDIDLLARLIVAEGGYTDTDQMRGVGQVVINRMAEYRMTLYQTIYQKGSVYVFSVVPKLRSIKPSETALSIAEELLQGKSYDKVKEALFFCTEACYRHKGWHYTASRGSKATIEYVCTLGSTMFFKLRR